MEQSIKGNNIEMIVSSSEESLELEHKALHLLINRHCDALLLYLENIGGPDIAEISGSPFDMNCLIPKVSLR